MSDPLMDLELEGFVYTGLMGDSVRELIGKLTEASKHLSKDVYGNFNGGLVKIDRNKSALENYAAWTKAFNAQWKNEEVRTKSYVIDLTTSRSIDLNGDI